MCPNSSEPYSNQRTGGVKDKQPGPDIRPPRVKAIQDNIISNFFLAAVIIIDLSPTNVAQCSVDQRKSQEDATGPPIVQTR
ncbi:hypothetical protein CDAR_489951 [Caerostris darwini]|uniref:Uncharacterized protein n=1 Tax=Caerostris darwini TaxID=1538125 RepID=A0AAV4TMY2_9ARAC|nr:hypothetical protein CDAR_489951 [Caerostris darwini]